MRRKIFVFSMIAICFAILAGGTLAYFTDEVTVTNIITMGKVDIEVVETMVEEDGTVSPFPTTGFGTVMPGGSASKIVQVQNNGTGDVWLRINVEVSAQDASGADLAADIITFTPLENWFEQEGYYYYNQMLPSGDLSTALFEEVIFAGSINNDYQGATINMEINASAVQAENNPIPDEGTVADVGGW